MAEWNVPYHFNICDIDFDVVFAQVFLPLEYKKPKMFCITVAFARNHKKAETIAAKTILNPRDEYSKVRGQKEVFRKIVPLIWAYWNKKDEIKVEDFEKKTWDIALLADTWDEE